MSIYSRFDLFKILFKYSICSSVFTHYISVHSITITGMLPVNLWIIPVQGNNDQFVSCKLIEEWAKLYTDWIFQEAEVVQVVPLGMQKEYYLHARIKGIFFPEWSGKKKKKRKWIAMIHTQKSWIQVVIDQLFYKWCEVWLLQWSPRSSSVTIHMGFTVLPQLAQMFSQLMWMELFSLQWDSSAVDV